MENELSPGFAGPVAPQPEDQEANPPRLSPAPPQTSNEMHSHFVSQEDRIALYYDKIKEAYGQLKATQTELEKLAAYGDTVTEEEIIEAASGMVAAGIPAVRVASLLATMPEQQSQLQAWVGEQAKKLAPLEAQATQALAKTGQQLGQAALQSIIAHSAEQHHQRALLAASIPQGSV